MKIKKLVQLGSTFLLSLSSLLVINLGTAAAASTVTWSGGDCPAVNCNWSNVNNWVGGVTPVSGDSVVFPNPLISLNAPVDDIAGLSLASISFTGAGLGDVTLNVPLTVTLAISQDSTATSSDVIEGTVATANLIMGGSVTVASWGGFTFGSSSAGDHFDLNGNSVTFFDQSGAPSNIVAIDAIIIGAGTVTYNAPVTNFQLNANNTYSGTTNVTASDNWVGNTTTNMNAFGTSTVNVATAGSISFSYDAAATISNPIVLSGIVNGSNVSQLEFNCGAGCATPFTITMPNITLNGDTRFSISDNNITVDVTGITANGHCVEYLVGGSNDATNFPGGPAACIVNASTAGSTAPATPDTGLAAIKAHPMAAFAAGTTAAAFLLIVARRLKPAVTR